MKNYIMTLSVLIFISLLSCGKSPAAPDLAALKPIDQVIEVEKESKDVDYKPNKKRITEIATWVCFCEGGIESIAFTKNNQRAAYRCANNKYGSFDYTETHLLFNTPCPGDRKMSTKS